MNEEKFSGKAHIYSKYRPSYPDSFISYLYSWVGFGKNSVIADVGSGTGILTKLLLCEGSTVYGIEPNDDMRQAAQALLREYPNFLSISAPAENTGLQDACVDFVTVAQAFHWFDRQKFKAECGRILKPNGKVILVWNNKDSSSPVVAEIDDLNRRFCPGYKGFSGGTHFDTPDAFAVFFRDSAVEYKVFENDLYLDEDSFIGGTLSASYTPQEGSESYQQYVSALKMLFKKYSSRTLLRLPNHTRSFAGQV